MSVAICSIFVSCLNSVDSNCLPWSVVKRAGTPKREIQWEMRCVWCYRLRGDIIDRDGFWPAGEAIDDGQAVAIATGRR